MINFYIFFINILQDFRILGLTHTAFEIGYCKIFFTVNLYTLFLNTLKDFKILGLTHTTFKIGYSLKVTNRLELTNGKNWKK